jgi:prenylcysteine oxidase/farnesylcysteine lyase
MWMKCTPCKVLSLWIQTVLESMGGINDYLKNSSVARDQRYCSIQLYVLDVTPLRTCSDNSITIKVTSITARSLSSTDWTVRSSAGAINYKAIIIAAPLHLSEVLIPSHISDQVPEQPAESLHVTVLTTTAAFPNPAYFGLSPSSSVARRILTTYEGKRQGGKEPEFFSLSYEGLVKEGEWVVKIWSREAISDDWLDDVFLKQVGWVHRKDVCVPHHLGAVGSHAIFGGHSGHHSLNQYPPPLSPLSNSTKTCTT